MKKKFFFQIIILGAFALIAFLPWIFHDSPGAVTSPMKNSTVDTPDGNLAKIKTARVNRTAFSQSLQFSGIVQAKHKSLLSFAVPARVMKKHVEVGSHVTRGQVLITLDDREYRNLHTRAEAAILELKVRMAQANKTRDRVAKLLAAKAATPEEFEHVETMADAVKAGYTAAQAQLADAGRVLSETELKAPFDGTITTILIEPGEFAAPGRPVVEISGDGALELPVEIPETVVAYVQVGQPVDIRLPFAADRIVTGRIASLSRAAVGPGRLFPLRIDLDDGDTVSAGMTAVALLKTREEAALNVPLEAVVNPGSSHPSVFLVRDDVIRKVSVKLGNISENMISVTGDLTVDDQVAVSGHTLVADGERVEVAL